MSPLQSWLLVGGCWAVVAAVIFLVGRHLGASGYFGDDDPAESPTWPLVSPPSPVRSFEELEFEREVLATIDGLPEVAA